LPIPLKTLFVAIRDVLEVAPNDLDQRVRSVLASLMRARVCSRYSSHLSQVGRVRFIEIHILVPADFRVETVQAVDDIRREVAARLEASWPQTWLTVDLPPILSGCDPRAITAGRRSRTFQAPGVASGEIKK